MKLTKISLALIISLVLMALICPSVQAEGESDSVDLSATVPLTISDVSASSIGYHGATISWKTNGDATSQVFYDTEFHDDIADYADHTIEETALVSEHSIRLTGLSSGRTYHYRVRSAIPDTEFIATSEDYTFTTRVRAVGVGRRPPALPPGTTDVRGEVSTAGVFLEPVTATSEDELCTLTIPEGTVGLTEELEPLDEVTMVIMDEPPPPPEDAYVVGLAYDLGPNGATFDPPITFTWSYDHYILPTGVAEKDLVLAYYDEDAGKWAELDCVVDTENNTITASVEHFTTFAIIARRPVPPPPPPVPAPAAFSLSNITVKPLEFQPKETVTITVSVANTGGTEGSCTVVLKINGVKEAEKSVTVAAGGSEIVTFSATREEARTYSVVVDGLSAFFIVVGPVLPPTPPPPTPLPEVKPPINWPVVGGAIAGVIVVGLLIFFLVRRRAA